MRLLFLEAWGRLGAIILDAAARNLLGDQTLGFLSFISAGAALVAFDQAAPALGMKISEADLRQLAHTLAPSVTTNPLKFGFEEDPELRSLFGLREPPTGALENLERRLCRHGGDADGPRDANSKRYTVATHHPGSQSDGVSRCLESDRKTHRLARTGCRVRWRCTLGRDGGDRQTAKSRIARSEQSGELSRRCRAAAGVQRREADERE